jgi:hypothetical protein
MDRSRAQRVNCVLDDKGDESLAGIDEYQRAQSYEVYRSVGAEPILNELGAASARGGYGLKDSVT